MKTFKEFTIEMKNANLDEGSQGFHKIDSAAEHITSLHVSGKQVHVYKVKYRPDLHGITWRHNDRDHYEEVASGKNGAINHENIKSEVNYSLSKKK